FDDDADPFRDGGQPVVGHPRLRIEGIAGEEREAALGERPAVGIHEAHAAAGGDGGLGGRGGRNGAGGGVLAGAAEQKGGGGEQDRERSSPGPSTRHLNPPLWLLPVYHDAGSGEG